MNIVVAPRAGFCFGVQRALNLVHEVRAGEKGPVATLGPLIHNPRVVSELVRDGVRVVDEPEEAGSGVLVIRSHGATPDELRRAAGAGLRVVDATCPCLKEAQRRTVELCDAGYDLVLLGERNHAEVRATVGVTGDRARVVESAAEAGRLDLGSRVALTSQTTQTFDTFREVAVALLERARELVIVNTICNATAERQNAAAGLARQVDVMVVVGGRISANTARLAEVCRAVGTRTFLIEDASELRQEWFQGVQNAGLTAGASTPQGQIEEVVRRMMEMDKPTTEQSAEQHEDGMAGPAAGDEYGGGYTNLEEGQIIEAVVVHVRDDMAFVDVGTKSELGIPVSELTTRDVQSAREVVAVGDRIKVLVVRAGDEDKILLSARKAEQEKNWVKIEAAYEDGTPIEGRVKEVVKGGLIVDIGVNVRAFVPASHITRGFTEDLSEFVGQVYLFKIIECNSEGRKRVVLSRRAMLEAEHDAAKKEVYGRLQPGEIKEGQVTRLADFGAFVDIGGGVEGLLHVSEISWDRVNNPADRLKAGQTVRVEVTKVDVERERISLSMRSLEPHPWSQLADRFPLDSVVTGTVTRVVPFGAFVKVADGIEGLVHISQLANHRVVKAEDVVSPGQTVQVRVIKVDPEARRLSLSMRESAPAANETEEEEYKKYMSTGPSMNTTIGDVVGGKKPEGE